MEWWGKETIIDLKDCQHNLIKDKLHISEFAIKICEVIKMKRFGEPIVEYFGQDEKVSGHSMMQLIETSLVSAHFVDKNNSAYINIFSCSDYDSELAAQFSADFFDSLSMRYQIILRY